MRWPSGCSGTRCGASGTGAAGPSTCSAPGRGSASAWCPSSSGARATRPSAPCAGSPRRSKLPLAKLVAADGDELLVRAGTGYRLPIDPGAPAQQRVERELLTPRNQSTIQLIRSTIPPGFSNEASPFRHLGTEVVTVESGSLLVVHGERRVVLGPGDSATYVCSTPHWWANESDGVTRVLGAVTPFEG